MAPLPMVIVRIKRDHARLCPARGVQLLAAGDRAAAAAAVMGVVVFFLVRPQVTIYVPVFGFQHAFAVAESHPEGKSPGLCEMDFSIY